MVGAAPAPIDGRRRRRPRPRSTPSPPPGGMEQHVHHLHLHANFPARWRLRCPTPVNPDWPANLISIQLQIFPPGSAHLHQPVHFQNGKTKRNTTSIDIESDSTRGFSHDFRCKFLSAGGDVVDPHLHVLTNDTIRASLLFITWHKHIIQPNLNKPLSHHSLMATIRVKDGRITRFRFAVGQVFFSSSGSRSPRVFSSLPSSRERKTTR